MIEVILPNGDRATCDRDALETTVSVLVAEATDNGQPSSWLRRNLIVVDEQGQYEGGTR